MFGNKKAIGLIMCSIVVYLAGRKKMTIIDNKVFTSIGGISYSIYLLHQNIGFIILQALEKNKYQPWMPLIAIVNGIVIGYVLDSVFIIVKEKIIKIYRKKNHDSPSKSI